MTIEQLIKDLNSYYNNVCYDNLLYCCDGQNLFYIYDVVVSHKQCFIFYKEEQDGIITPRNLVAKLRRYSYQQNWPILFVNIDTNDFYSKETSVADYNVRMNLQP